jgi:IclR family pca regulon transcriptional regulator
MRTTTTTASGPGRRNYVASLEKGLAALTCFDGAHTRLTLSEVARLTASSPASARRSLLTLRALGYVTSEGKHFQLSSKSLLVAHAFLSSRPTPGVAQPFLDALSDRSRESACIAELLDNEAIIIARSTTRRSLSRGISVGSRLPAYCSAVGRILLAGEPQDAVRRRLKRIQLQALTPRTIVDRDAVLERVSAARELGYSVCDGELELGVLSVALPIRSREGRTIAALAMAVRTDRTSHADVTRTLLPALRRVQSRLAERLTGR